MGTSQTLDLDFKREQLKASIPRNGRSNGNANPTNRSNSNGQYSKAPITKTEHFSVKHANKVMGLVYVGAAILIIIVGLRGLGTSVSNMPMIPAFLIDSLTNKIDSSWVMFALFLEFFMLMLLSLTTYFTPNDIQSDESSENEEPVHFEQIKHPDFRQSMQELKEYTEAELNLMKSYVNEFEEISGRINKIQAANVEALKKMSESLR